MPVHWSDIGGRSGRGGPPKTAESLRTVPVDEGGTGALLMHVDARPSKERLFTAERGEPLNFLRRKAEWNCACRAPRAAEGEAAEREGREPV
ncbi:hypothetical protein ACIRP2_12150 [Streptomyces sp. NPDC101194]|uniref:hypothetical protein n=1 Tax=Streptomyces sp. NPDC101194 TaxID=3366127 RepID=UPI0038221A78